MGDTSEHRSTADSGILGRWNAFTDYVDEYWHKRPMFYLSATAFLLGSLLFLGILLVLAVIPGDEPPTIVAIAIGALIVGGLGLWFCRLNKKQQHYLDIVNRERDELGEYDRLLKDYLPAEKLDRQARVERAETIARIGTARKQLTEARRAVYREDYVSFLTAYYWANAQRIFIYDLLDAAELDDGSKRINWSLDIDLARLSGRQIREEGTIDVPATNRSGTRLWNLTKWLWLTSRSLPESEREEVNEYLLRDDNELKRSLSPQELYRALGVIHMWDIQRISDLMSIKRTLRYLVPALAALLVFVVATVHVNPGGFIDELAANGTVDGALFESWFVLLVVGTGILGALFSMALFMRDTTSQVTSYRSIPDPTILRETILVGLLIGGVSALVLYVLLLSSIGDAFFEDSLRENPLSILFVAFLGGYSERLVQRSLDKAEQMIATSEDDRLSSERRLPGGRDERAG